MNIRRLVLGTAAGALAVTGAQAADLPVVVEPVDYVRICDAFGDGYFFIPGTETCIEIGGRVRVDYNIYFDLDDAGPFGNGPGSFGFDNGESNHRFRARGQIKIDTRTATELGLLRAYIEYEGNSRNDGTSPDEGGFDFFVERDLFVEMDKAFISLGGLIFGRTTTFSAAPGVGDGFGVYTPEQTFDLGNNNPDTTLLGYSASFGNGFAAGIALEDSVDRRVGLTSAFRGPNLFTFETVVAATYDGNQVPDVSAYVGVEQGWGAVFLSGSLHYVEGRLIVADNFDSAFIAGEPIETFGPGVTTVFRDDELGWAVRAGVEVNVPFGASTVVGIQGGYAKGALDYVADGPDGIGAQDGLFVGNNLELGDFYAVAGGFAAGITPDIALAAGVGYVNMDHAGTFADTENWNANAFLGYTPVDGLTFGLGAEYRYVDNAGGADGDALTVFFRAQRAF